MPDKEAINEPLGLIQIPADDFIALIEQKEKQYKHKSQWSQTTNNKLKTIKEDTKIQKIVKGRKGKRNHAHAIKNKSYEINSQSRITNKHVITERQKYTNGQRDPKIPNNLKEAFGYNK